MVGIDFAGARQRMVTNQIRTNGVSDPLVINAIASLPREVFVSQIMQKTAYRDEDIPISSGRYLVKPAILARLLQLVCVQPTDIILDIGCATGYSSGVLARMAATVIALESDPILAETAATVLAAQGIDNVVVVTAPLNIGYPMQAPYDVIVFEGAVGIVPEDILDQLSEGGRLVAMVQKTCIATATLVIRVGKRAFSRRTSFTGNLAKLPGFEQAARFVF